MTVTRDSDVAPEIGALFQAFNHAANGFEIEVVLQASVNMLIAAINHRVQAQKVGREAAVADAHQIAAQLPNLVTYQWDRAASPEDIEVPLNGN